MKTDILFLIIVLTFPAIVFSHLPKYPLRTSLWPLIVGGILLILVAVQIIRELSLERTKGHAATTPKSPQRYVAPIAWIVAILPIVYLLGLIVTVPLYTFLYLKGHKQGWLISTVLPIIFFVAIYFVFIVLLKAKLYEGLLFRLI